MPFEHADKLKYNGDDDYDSDATELYEPGASSGFTSASGGVTSGIAHGSDSESSDDILSTIQNLENQQKKYLTVHINQLKRHKYVKLRAITIGNLRVNHLR